MKKSSIAAVIGLVAAGAAIGPAHCFDDPPRPLRRPLANATGQPAAQPEAQVAASADAEAAACLERLTVLRVKAVFRGAGVLGTCSVDNTVELQSVETLAGPVNFADKPVLACAFAVTLASFVQDVASPLARANFSSLLARISTGPGFVCRNRNNQPDAKPSEHAKAAAVDVAGFALADGRQIAVRLEDAGEASERSFLRGLRHAACGYFTTVLGPGSNVEHGSHFHFDLALHGRTANYRICE